MTRSLADFPLTMVGIGAVLVIVAYGIMVFKPAWSKFAITFMILGAFGVAGASGGWWGRLMANVASHAADASGRVTHSMVGVSIPAAIFVIIALCAWRAMGKGGKGMTSKGNAVSSKAKDVLKLTALGLVGAGAAAIPGLYEMAAGLIPIGTDMVASR